MRRADRLFQIVQYLRGGRLITAAQLAERLEVSERTIYRDIADLQSTGVPVDGEAGVGYVMREGFDLPPLMFTNDEITALVAGARLIRAWGGMEMARAAEEALVKIDAVLPDAVRSRAQTVGIHAIAPEMTDVLKARLDRVDRAISNRLPLKIVYTREDGAGSERTVRPLSVWFWGKVWTLITWCELREDFRMFRLDRIVEMTEQEVPFRQERGKTLQDFFRLEAPGGHPGGRSF